MGDVPEVNKITATDALKELQDAWRKGVEIGTDLNRARAAQRIVIASRIKAERTNAGISQEELSERIHANTLTYKGYENCKSDIPIAYLVRIANELNVSLDYLTGRTDQREVDSNQLEARINRLEKALFQNRQ